MTRQGTGKPGPHVRVAVVDGVRLRQLRAKSGLSQEDLAWKAGVGLSTVARLERGQRSRCRGYTVGRLAAVLGQPAGAMLATLAPHAPGSSGMVR